MSFPTVMFTFVSLYLSPRDVWVLQTLYSCVHWYPLNAVLFAWTITLYSYWFLSGSSFIGGEIVIRIHTKMDWSNFMVNVVCVRERERERTRETNLDITTHKTQTPTHVNKCPLTQTHTSPHTLLWKHTSHTQHHHRSWLQASELSHEFRRDTTTFQGVYTQSAMSLSWRGVHSERYCEKCPCCLFFLVFSRDFATDREPLTSRAYFL